MRPISFGTIGLVLALGTGPALSVFAQTSPKGDAGVKDADKTKTVLTYYGIRKLELRPDISDEEKLREWQAFIERSKDQLTYAHQAVDRWKNAARLRVIEQVREDDRNQELSPAQKIDGWKRLLELYPKSAEAKLAQKRVAYWNAEQTKRLVEEAEKVEKARGSKVDRILAWRKVEDWAKKGPEARAASKRIDALETQLFSEAQNVDKVPRVAPQTKLAIWRDVLAANSRASYKKVATQRIAELEQELGKDKDAGTAP